MSRRRHAPTDFRRRSAGGASTPVTGVRFDAIVAIASGVVVAACAASSAAADAPAPWPPGGGPAWMAAANGAVAPAAVVVASAAAWRQACARLGLRPDAAPAAWRSFAAGVGLAVVVPAGYALAGAPARADEEGVEVLTFTAAPADDRGAAVCAWTLPADGRRRAIVYRDGSEPKAAEQLLWVDPP